MFFSTKSAAEIGARLAQLQADLEQTKGAIRAAEIAAAEAVAQGADADFATIGTLKVKAAAMQSAQAILEAEKMAAERRERIHGAKLKRELAQQRRAEAASIAVKRDKLLAQLGTLEGVVFDGSILSAQRVGPWMRNLVVNSRIPDDLRAPGEMYPDLGVNPGRYAVPRSRVLLDEAFALEDEAAAIDASEGVAEVEPTAEPEPVGRG